MVLRQEPVGPLTGTDSEWGEPFSQEGTVQNNRCSHVFKEADGTAYDADGIVFEDLDGFCYTSLKSRVPVIFPYTPNTKYVKIDKSY